MFLLVKASPHHCKLEKQLAPTQSDKYCVHLTTQLPDEYVFLLLALWEICDSP